MLYKEINREYNKGIMWKRAIHRKHGTQLLETYSADFYCSDIKATLKKRLEDAGVPIQEKTDEELCNVMLPRESEQEKLFVRRIATFITLMKSSCKSIQTVLLRAKEAGDQRSAFIIQYIFQPAYECYTEILNEKHRLDFTDLIWQATEICRTRRPVEYDYIIVDEFQDISRDCYNFLQALKEGNNPPAKLYCVGDDWQSIYRFSGSDITFFSRFADYFGPTEVNKLETTYRFGEPLLSLSSHFVQRNQVQIDKKIRPSNFDAKTQLEFHAYNRHDYCDMINGLIFVIPSNRSVLLLGRYSFDDYYLSCRYKMIKEGSRFYYLIAGRKIEFLTIHKSKGLEADYVILLQCNKDIYGFPSLVSDDPVLNYAMSAVDQFLYGEERRLFYVAITRAKVKTIVLYDKRCPSVFVDEFLRPEEAAEEQKAEHSNADRRWTRAAERFLLKLYGEGNSLQYIATKMGRSRASIAMRLRKLSG